MLRVELSKRRGSFRLEAGFTLPRAGVLALFGPSGCGKSTLIQCIAGLEDPDGGQIELDGECFFDAVARSSVPAEKRGIGYVFQDARLFPHLSVAGNLGYGASRSRRKPFVGFDEVVDLLNLRSLLARRPGRLSGGERQRVAIGRALLSQPRLLLLDEPLASLDAARREEVLPYLERLRDRLALRMVYVSHQFDEVLRLATDLVLMRDGSVIAQGDIATVSRGPALRSLISADMVGAVLEARPLGPDERSGLMRLQVGNGELQVPADGLEPGRTVRVQLLARDIIIATEPVAHLSVRNSLAGVIDEVSREDAGADLLSIDIGGGELLLARITPAATAALGLQAGRRVWALIKAGAIRGHSFAAPAAAHARGGEIRFSD